MSRQHYIDAIQQRLNPQAIDAVIETARTKAGKPKSWLLRQEVIGALQSFLTNVAKQLLEAHKAISGVAKDFPRTVMETFRSQGYDKIGFGPRKSLPLLQFLDWVNHTFTERQIRLMTPAEFAQLYFDYVPREERHILPWGATEELLDRRAQAINQFRATLQERVQTANQARVDEAPRSSDWFNSQLYRMAQRNPCNLVVCSASSALAFALMWLAWTNFYATD